MLNQDASIHLVLASASPRRRELLALTGWKAEIRPAHADERPKPGEAAHEMAQRLAHAKARAVTAGMPLSSLVLAADTIVAHDGDLLGKPADAAEAQVMLETLRGCTHEVVTGLTLLADGGAWHAEEICTTPVPMRDYTPREVQEYVASGAAFDKAGAYGIQDRGFDPVDLSHMTGCFANVMGLPLCHLVRLMRRRGLRPAADVPVACQAFTGYACGVYPQILGSSA